MPHHSQALYQQLNEYFDLRFGIFVEGSWDFAIAGDRGPESTNQFPRDDGTHPLARRRPRRALHRLGPLTGEGTSAGCFVSADELARNDAGPCPSRKLHSSGDPPRSAVAMTLGAARSCQEKASTNGAVGPYWGRMP